jgi:hypothetical protein
MDTLTIRYERRGPSFYYVYVGDSRIGKVYSTGSHRWHVMVDGPYKPPLRPLPTRKAAAEWLAAASGLWLVTR